MGGNGRRRWLRRRPFGRRSPRRSGGGRRRRRLKTGGRRRGTGEVRSGRRGSGGGRWRSLRSGRSPGWERRPQGMGGISRVSARPGWLRPACPGWEAGLRRGARPGRQSRLRWRTPHCPVGRGARPGLRCGTIGFGPGAGRCGSGPGSGGGRCSRGAAFFCDAGQAMFSWVDFVTKSYRYPEYVERSICCGRTARMAGSSPAITNSMPTGAG
jgi:hypothetical protein